MKLYISFILLAGFAISMHAQNGVEITLGASGEFEIKNNSDDLLFKIHETGWTGANGEFEFNSHDNGSTIVHIMDHGHNNKLYFDYSNAGLGNVVNGDGLGQIWFNGFHNGNYRLGAYIDVSVDGSPISTNVPATIRFLTNDGSSTEVRMSIRADGTINISDLAGSYTGGSAAVIVDDNGNLSTDDTTDLTDELEEEIHQLKAEIQALKTEMHELREIVHLK